MATVRVIRAFRRLEKKEILLSFKGFGARVVSDGPSEPVLRKNGVYILPLKTDGTIWSVVEKRDTITILPGADRLQDAVPAATAKAFLLRELTNALVEGSVEDMYKTAEFLQFQPSEDLPSEVVARLHSRLTDESVRLRELAAVFLTSSLFRRDSLLGLSPEPLPRSGHIASLLFHELPERGRMKTIMRILVRWIGDSDFPWQFGAHIHTTLIPHFNSDLAELLSEELHNPQQGTIYVASWLAESGERSILGPSVTAAIRALRMKTMVHNDLIAAGRLIVNHGDDAQFEDYLQVLVQARMANDPRYDSMWWLVESQKGPRVLRIFATILQDERPSQRGSMDHGWRYCDIAGLRLQQAVGVNFGFRNSGHFDAAVVNARRWATANLPR
jgi:hypothetical protein